MESLLIKLPKSPGKYNLQSAITYYSSFTISDDFYFGNKEEKVLKIMTHIKSSKAAWVDKLFGRFLKDGTKIRGRKLILQATGGSHCFHQNH